MNGLPLEKATRAEMLTLLNECAKGWPMSRDRLEWRLRELRVSSLLSQMDTAVQQMSRTSSRDKKYWDLNARWKKAAAQLDKIQGIGKAGKT